MCVGVGDEAVCWCLLINVGTNPVMKKKKL